MRLITLKKEQNNFSKCSALLLPHFCTYFFTLNSAVFVNGGAQEYFLPQRAGYPSYATAS